MDLELISRVAMNLSAGMLIVPLAAVLIASASSVVLFAAIQLALRVHLWFNGLPAEATVVNAGLAWRARGGDFYSVEYRFTVPPALHSYSGEARSTTRFTQNQ